ncbi:MAG: SDR family NAD(P)-dependent oxidoreductase [Mariniblastus sp.]|nr:SDR family NAD(P)-dependent oxidoreductase [Mariniblastus sp.]
MPYRNLQNKRAVVTGASSGIGWHLVQQLAAEGVSVIACARRAELLDDLSKQIQSKGGTCIPLVGDITSEASRQEIIDVADREFGGLDILVNNAGIGAMGRFDESAESRLRKVFEVNFFAIAEMIRVSLPRLKQGHSPLIVNMSSVLAHRATPLKSEYCASKFALHGFSDALRAELANDSIDLLLVSPSTTDSEFFDHAIEDTTGKNWKTRGAMPPSIVASKTIRAMKKGKHEIILTLGGRLIVWMDRLIPGIANRIMARYGQ